ncbi:MAG: zinc ribbon domain-containing protein [Clostridiales Family XIII bacterium]|nr:zinc ribbon domain-containing protein [Clostridiales Family XIII bacterium]
MPLYKDKNFGTHADGTKNQDYGACRYTDGEFTRNVKMEGRQRSVRRSWRKRTGIRRRTWHEKVRGNGFPH